MQRWGKTAQKMRVPLGTLLGAIFLVLMRPSPTTLAAGAFVALAGAALRLWAAGYIDKGRCLAREGPYARTRNPLYLGSFLMALGVLLAGQGYVLLVPFFVFYVAFYYPVMRAEERELLAGYGDEFIDYARRVPLFLPRLAPAAGGASRFEWRRVVRNREHRTVLGLLGAGVFLFLLTRADQNLLILLAKLGERF